MLSHSDGLHRVDVPVTDLDYTEDSVQSNDYVGSPNVLGQFDVSSLDELDYENNRDYSNRSVWFERLRNWLNPRKDERSNSYELLNLDENYGVCNSSTEEDDLPFNLRKRPVRQLIYFMVRSSVLFLLILGVISCSIVVLRKGAKSTEAVRTKPVMFNGTHKYTPTTILISLDGFHPHYINTTLTPNLHELMVESYSPPYMIPSFPSSTFPNHWTMVTGLYPSEHGIVGNTFFDPELGKRFVNTRPKEGGLDPDFWQGGEPIWSTAFKQGIRSVADMWPGSEVPGVGINGGLFEVGRFNGSELLSLKAETILHWLDRETPERPELILSYVPTIDQIGHKVGIYGAELEEGLMKVDSFIGIVLKGLEDRNLTNLVNVVVASDHGMAPTSNDRLIFIDDLVDLSKIEHIDGWPLFGLRPFKQYNVNQIIEELREKTLTLDERIRESFEIYKIEDLPEEWNFGGPLRNHHFNYRLAPIWVIPKVGYAITTHEQMQEYKDSGYRPKGIHGYNNTEVLMRATFFGQGPYFSSSLSSLSENKVKPFSNVEIYNIICDTLNLSPSPNNGSITNEKKSGIFSSSNLLPEGWRDSLKYENWWNLAETEVINSTYEYLYGNSLKPPIPHNILQNGSNETGKPSVASSTGNVNSLTSGLTSIPHSLYDNQIIKNASGVFHSAINGADQTLHNAESNIQELIDKIFHHSADPGRRST